MKKILLTTILVFSFVALSNTIAVAQEHDPTKLGVSVLYGDEPESAGLKVDVTFRVSPQIAIAPDVSIYFPDEDEVGYESFWAINLNGHYIFDAASRYHLYGLGGLNVTSVEVGGNDDSHSELGINLGIGGEYHLQNFSLFSELKYVIGDLDHVVLGAGVRFPLN